MPEHTVITNSITRAGAVVVLALSLFPGSPAANAQTRVPFGVNGDWDYVDLAKTSNRWEAIAGGNVAMDQNGWPMGDASLVLFDTRKNMPWNGPDPDGVEPDISGTYKMSFTGQATLEVWAPGYIDNQVYDAATNTTTADLVLMPFSSLVFLRFIDTKRLPDGDPGTGFTNLKIMRPGYPLNTTQVFTDATLRAYAAPFAAVRMLGPDATNDYAGWVDAETKEEPTVTRWADRVKVTDAYQGGLPQNNVDGKQSHGHAWEYMIAFCNAIKRDIWLNVPVTADDEYVTQLARLLKFGNEYSQGLDPNLRIYLEYSNEVWNEGFPQGAYNTWLAEQQGITRTQLYVRRSMEIAKIFRDVFGQGTMKHRIRPVVVWQYRTQMEMFEALKWWQEQYGEPASDYAYGIGQAGYYDPTDTATVGDIFTTLWLGSDATRREHIAWQAVAAYFGLEQVSYEIGPSVNAGRWGGWPMDNAAYTGATATRDARMAPSEVHHFLDNWFAAGGATACFFAMRGNVQPWGNWLLVEDFDKLDTPKMAGALEIMAAPAPKLTAGHVLPWQIGQTVAIDGSQRTPDPWMPDLEPGSPLVLPYASEYPFKLDHVYLLRAVAEGKYAIRLFGKAESGAEIRVFADNEELGTVTLPEDEDGESTAVSVTLLPGLHGLRITNTGSADAMLAGNGANIRVTMTSGNGKGDVPSAPMNVKAAAGDGQVALIWAAAASATGYRVKRSAAPWGPYADAGSPEANSYVDTGVTNGTTYYYAITAVNAAGEGALSPVVEAMPVPGAPGMPVIENLRAMNTSGGAGYFPGGQVWFEWQPIPNAERYEVQRRGAPWWGQDFNPDWWWWETVMTQKATWFGETNLFPDMPYQYKVVAVNAAGRTESVEVLINPPSAVQAPSVPEGLTATAVPDGIALRWQPVMYLTPVFWPPQYRVKRATASGGPYEVLAEQSPANLVDRTAAPGTTYCYVVSAWGNGGESANSAEVCTAR